MKKHLSQRAIADIAERVEAARPHVYMELLLLVGSRNSLVTPEQINALGAVASHLFHADEIVARLLEASVDAGISPGLVTQWHNSDAGRDVIARAHADRGNDHLIQVRRDPSIKELVDLYGVTAEEENSLNLTHLVSERRRSELRRRAEGIAAAVEAVQTDAAEPKPWEAAGVSKSTHYARLNRAAEQSAAALMAEATGHSVVEKEPWKALGISKATWHRRNAKAGETKTRTTRDPIGVKGTVGTYPTYFTSLKYRVAGSPVFCLTHTEPPAYLTPTAECRQHVAKSLRLGLVWEPRSDQLSAALRDWVCPPDHEITDAQWDGWNASYRSAERSLTRHYAIERARDQKREALRDERIAAGQEPPRGEAAAAERAATRVAKGQDLPPHGVTPEVWAWVPTSLKKQVVELAGVIYLTNRDVTAELAVAEATEILSRMAAIKVVLSRAIPGGGQHLIQCVPDWNAPTYTAVEAAIDRYRREQEIVELIIQARPDADRERAEMLVNKHFKAKDVIAVVLENIDPPPPPEPLENRELVAYIKRYVAWDHKHIRPDESDEIVRYALAIAQRPSEIAIAEAMGDQLGFRMRIFNLALAEWRRSQS